MAEQTTVPLRAVLYVRISDDPEGLEKGVDRQEADCRVYAEAHGYEVVEVFRGNLAAGWLRRFGEAGTVTGHGGAGDEVFEVAGAAVSPILVAEVLVEGMGVGTAARAGYLHDDAAELGGGVLGGLD